MAQVISPNAMMLLGTHCPYCPVVLDGLTQLVKMGKISRLDIINLEQEPEIARELGVRTVPWVRIGPFELEGKQTPAELAEWAARASSNKGIMEYLSELLNTGRINKAETLIQNNPAYFQYLLDLFSDSETSLNIRVGIGALMEMLAGSGIMHSKISNLGELTKHDSPLVRIDACHYLSLTEQASVKPFIEPLLNDPDESVREVAQESLDTLNKQDVRYQDVI